MKETVNIKINQLPSKTWHWLKLNETNFAWTDEAQDCTIVKKESTENEALSLTSLKVWSVICPLIQAMQRIC